MKNYPNISSYSVDYVKLFPIEILIYKFHIYSDMLIYISNYYDSVFQSSLSQYKIVEK